MKSSNVFSVAILSVSMSGCAGLVADRQDILSYEGYHGHSTLGRIVHDLTANPAVFGGVDEESDLHAARVNFGVEGMLMAINERAMQQARIHGDEGDCEDHVEAVTQLLAGREGFTVEPIYSRPMADIPDAPGHVSALVTDPDGEQWVLDNRAVLAGPSLAEFNDRDSMEKHRSAVVALAGMARKEVFLAQLNGQAWEGDDGRALATLP